MLHSMMSTPSSDDFDVELKTRVRLAVRPTGAGWGPRQLKHFVFMWIHEGHSQWIVDGRPHRLVPGAIALGRPGMRDELRWDPSGSSSHGYVGFTLRNAGPLPPADTWPLLRVLPRDDVVRPLLRHAAWLTDARPPEWERQTSLAMRLALLAFVSGSVRAGAQWEDEIPPALGRVLIFMRQRWDRGVAQVPSLRELAAVAAVSPGYLCRLFRRHHGCGPIEAIRFIQLESATDLLGRPNLPVREVAVRCGFNDPLYFTRRFTRLFGMPPSAYRARLLRGEPVPATASTIRGLGHLAEALARADGKRTGSMKKRGAKTTVALR